MPSGSPPSAPNPSRVKRIKCCLSFLDIGSISQGVVGQGRCVIGLQEGMCPWFFLCLSHLYWGNSCLIPKLGWWRSPGKTTLTSRGKSLRGWALRKFGCLSPKVSSESTLAMEVCAQTPWPVAWERPCSLDNLLRKKEDA